MLTRWNVQKHYEPNGRIKTFCGNCGTTIERRKTLGRIRDTVLGPCNCAKCGFALNFVTPVAWLQSGKAIRREV